MEDAGVIFNGIMQVANVMAWIVISVMFIQGRIVSLPTFNKFIEANKEITSKLTQEISDQIEAAVESGVIKAYTKMNGKAESGD